jgi:hypothetical protein
MTETKEKTFFDSKEEILFLNSEKNSALRKVHLNVSGRKFEVTDTSLKYSGCFSALLDDKTFGKDPNQPVFIDRDSDVFSQVLSCMRNNGKLLERPTLRLLKEIDYFVIKIYNPYDADIFINEHGNILKELTKSENRNMSGELTEPERQKAIEDDIRASIKLIEKSDTTEISVSLKVDGYARIHFRIGEYTFQDGKIFQGNKISISGVKWDMHDFFLAFINKCVLKSLRYFGWNKEGTDNEVFTATRY